MDLFSHLQQTVSGSLSSFVQGGMNAFSNAAHFRVCSAPRLVMADYEETVQDLLMQEEREGRQLRCVNFQFGFAHLFDKMKHTLCKSICGKTETQACGSGQQRGRRPRVLRPRRRLQHLHLHHRRRRSRRLVSQVRSHLHLRSIWLLLRNTIISTLRRKRRSLSSGFLFEGRRQEVCNVHVQKISAHFARQEVCTKISAHFLFARLRIHGKVLLIGTRRSITRA